MYKNVLYTSCKVQRRILANFEQMLYPQSCVLEIFGEFQKSCSSGHQSHHFNIIHHLGMNKIRPLVPKFPYQLIIPSFSYKVITGSGI